MDSKVSNVNGRILWLTGEKDWKKVRQTKKIESGKTASHMAYLPRDIRTNIFEGDNYLVGFPESRERAWRIHEGLWNKDYNIHKWKLDHRVMLSVPFHVKEHDLDKSFVLEKKYLTPVYMDSFDKGSFFELFFEAVSASFAPAKPEQRALWTVFHQQSEESAIPLKDFRDYNSPLNDDRFVVPEVWIPINSVKIPGIKLVEKRFR